MNTADTNINQAEINKFNKLADGWWDRDGLMSSLHAINPIRLSFIISNLPVTVDECHMLDVGCGGGILAESLAQTSMKTTAIDVASDVIAVAKKHAEQAKVAVDYRNITIADMVATGEQFDAVSCMEMLEHVPDPEQTIMQCAKLLKPNGRLFVSTINRNAQSFIKAIVAAEYILNLVPKGTHQYKQFIKPSELMLFGEQHGLTLQKSQGIKYNPLLKSFAPVTNLDINYMLMFEKTK